MTSFKNNSEHRLVINPRNLVFSAHVGIYASSWLMAAVIQMADPLSSVESVAMQFILVVWGFFLLVHTLWVGARFGQQRNENISKLSYREGYRDGLLDGRDDRLAKRRLVDDEGEFAEELMVDKPKRYYED